NPVDLRSHCRLESRPPAAPRSCFGCAAGASSAGASPRPHTRAASPPLSAPIPTKYGNDGYIPPRAIVPPQELSPGGAVVTIQIVEGYIDRVEWPAALSSHRNFFDYYAARIIADRPTNIRTMERYLLLSRDIPG